MIENQPKMTWEYSKVFLKSHFGLDTTLKSSNLVLKTDFWTVLVRTPYFGPQCPQIVLPQPKIGPQCPYPALQPHIIGPQCPYLAVPPHIIGPQCLQETGILEILDLQPF